MTAMRYQRDLARSRDCDWLSHWIVFIDSPRSVCHSRAVIDAELGPLDDAAVALARPVRLHHVDDAARPRRHDADAVGEHGRLVERVRDEEHGRRRLAPQAQEFVAHQEARLLVERAERLVEQDQARLHDERARDAHALAHAARELRGIARREVGQADELQHVARRACPSRRAQATSDAGRTRRCPRRRATRARRPPGTRRRCRRALRPRSACLRTRSCPRSRGVRPAMSSSSVDLPQPDGPTTAKNSPLRISKSIGPTACRGAGGRPVMKVLPTLSSRTCAVTHYCLIAWRSGGRKRVSMILL